MKIGKKITSGYVLILVLMLVIGVVVFIGIGRIGSATKSVIKRLDDEELISKIHLNSIEKYQIIADTIINQNIVEQKAAYEKTVLAMGEIEKEADVVMDTEEEKAWMQEFDRANADLDTLFFNSIVPEVEYELGDVLHTIDERSDKAITEAEDVGIKIRDSLVREFDEAVNGNDEVLTRRRAEDMHVIDMNLFWLVKKYQIQADLILHENVEESTSLFTNAVRTHEEYLSLLEAAVDTPEEIKWFQVLAGQVERFDDIFYSEVIPAVNRAKENRLSNMDNQADLLVAEMANKSIRIVESLRNEIGESRAERNNISRSVLVITAVLFIIAVLAGITVAFLITRGVVGPLKSAVSAARQIEEGDLTLTLRDVDRQDETGDLIRSFVRMSESLNQMSRTAEQIAAGNLVMEVVPRSEKDILGIALADMVESLRKQTREIAEGANVLASSSNEILALSSQLVASSTESSTALVQTTTTVEEVKQTTISSNDKAKSISDDFQKTNRISQDGEKATEDTIKGMELIKAQMETIAESIVRLSEQSQTVGEIISSVDDIAEQSNLLAVNAAIEASRAGEQGKGFTVVAEEIKTLSEQSKRATAQVRGILNDIQKATSNAVMATEEGGKIVDAGAEHTSKAGEAIRRLADSVSESSQAATQIAASGQQQQAGMEQIAKAMQDIRIASEQNLNGTKQMEEASHNLSDLGRKLQELLSQYSLSKAQA
jgi:methyl-accepting chemotaxis protein